MDIRAHDAPPVLALHERFPMYVPRAFAYALPLLLLALLVPPPGTARAQDPDPQLIELPGVKNLSP